MNMKKVFIIFILIFAFCTNFTLASQYDMLINEIAWMGTNNSANDEWMELLNTTDNIIDLSGWVLKSSDEKLKINLLGAIPARGFYLLERTDESSAPNIAADLIYKGALSNSGMDLKLYDGFGNLIDQANYLSGWQAGDNKTKQTMERAGLIWQTSKNALGTPREENSRGITSNSPAQAQASSDKQLPVSNQNQNLTTVAQDATSNIIYPEGIFINEILPAPEGPDETDEWIELYNGNNFDVDLSGWKIKDIEGSTSEYIFPANAVIKADEFLVLKRPNAHIALNDKTDEIQLAQPNGNIINIIRYSESPKNQSYNRIESSSNNADWQWSSILTPGNKNIIGPKNLPKPKKSDTKTSVATSAVEEPINNIIEDSNEEGNIQSPWTLLLITLGFGLIAGAAVIIFKPNLFKKISSIMNHKS